MFIHLAVGNTKGFIDLFKELNVENMLISYAYFKSPNDYLKVAGNWIPKRMILDSGAFSVWTKGDKINIDNYINFCKGMREIVPQTTELHYVNLDVLPGRFGEFPTNEQRQSSAEEGWKNMEYMNSKGLKVIHVFHQHEDFKWLHKLIKKDDYIGISPANDVSMTSKKIWLDQVFSIVQNKIKCHGFAVTGKEHLIRYPFYSVDSSSWIMGGRFAEIKSFSQGKQKGAIFKNKEQLLSIWDNLQTKDTALLTDYMIRHKNNIIYYQELEEFVTNVWNKRGIKFN